MKKTLSHLPKEIAETIEEIAEIIRTVADPEMIILFGSYARGDYVVRDTYTDPEDHRTYEYRSDYDFLVITGREDRAKANWLWQKCEKQIREAGKVDHNLPPGNRRRKTTVRFAGAGLCGGAV